MSLPKLTAAGNLTADPELRYTQSGLAVANFTLACNQRRQNRDTGEWEEGIVTFVRCTAWRSLAENVANTLRKGDGAIAVGELEQSEYETREGEKRTAYGLAASDVAASMRYATAVVTRSRRETSDAFGASTRDDAWAAESPSRGRRAAAVAA